MASRGNTQSDLLLSRKLFGKNRLLAGLSAEELARLAPELKLIHLPKRTVLSRAGETVKYCYFPLNGMISLLAPAENGKSIIVGIVGNDGVAGFTGLLEPDVTPFEIAAQIPVDALRVRVAILRAEFQKCGHLQMAVIRYVRRLLLDISQSAVCHSFHTVEQRLSSWLLIAANRAQADEFSLTQNCLAQMLGVPRTNVTMTARSLQEKGLISYKRGQIKLTNRETLAQSACECYRMLQRENDVSD